MERAKDVGVDVEELKAAAEPVEVEVEDRKAVFEPVEQAEATKEPQNVLPSLVPTQAPPKEPDNNVSRMESKSPRQAQPASDAHAHALPIPPSSPSSSPRQRVFDPSPPASTTSPSAPKSSRQNNHHHSHHRKQHHHNQHRHHRRRHSPSRSSRKQASSSVSLTRKQLRTPLSKSIPSAPLASYTTLDVASMLYVLGLKAHIKKVVACNGIDGRALVEARGEEDVKEMGIGIGVNARRVWGWIVEKKWLDGGESGGGRRKELRTLTAEDVGKELGKMGCGRYRARWNEEGVDGETLLYTSSRKELEKVRVKVAFE